VVDITSGDTGKVENRSNAILREGAGESHPVEKQQSLKIASIPDKGGREGKRRGDAGNLFILITGWGKKREGN